MKSKMWILSLLVGAAFLACSNPYSSNQSSPGSAAGPVESPRSVPGDSTEAVGSLSIALTDSETTEDGLGALSHAGSVLEAENVAAYYVNLHRGRSEQPFGDELRINAVDGVPEHGALFDEVPVGLWTISVRGETSGGEVILEGSRANIEVTANARVTVTLVLFRIGEETLPPGEDAGGKNVPSGDEAGNRSEDTAQGEVEQAELTLTPSGHHGDRFVSIDPNAPTILEMEGSGERRVFFGDADASDAVVELRGVRLAEDSPGWGVFFHGAHNEMDEFTGYSLQFDYGLSRTTGGVIAVRRWVEGRRGGREIEPFIRIPVADFPGLNLHAEMDVMVRTTATTVDVTVKQNGMSYEVLNLRNLQNLVNEQALANAAPNSAVVRSSGVLGIRTWNESQLEVDSIVLSRD